jgi:hypothetical protein
LAIPSFANLLISDILGGFDIPPTRYTDIRAPRSQRHHAAALARNVMVVMQQQVSEKAKHKPNGSFQDSLESGRHQQRIRLLRTGCQRHARSQQREV